MESKGISACAQSQQLGTEPGNLRYGLALLGALARDRVERWQVGTLWAVVQKDWAEERPQTVQAKVIELRVARGIAHWSAKQSPRQRDRRGEKGLVRGVGDGVEGVAGRST